VLLTGTLLAPGRRTVTAASRVPGLAQGRRFERSHRVLSRARWSGLAVSRVLLRLLVVVFVPTGPLVVGVDETVEWRRGRRARKSLPRCGAVQPRALREVQRWWPDRALAAVADSTHAAPKFLAACRT
jgi:hypothetical protein